MALKIAFNVLDIFRYVYNMKTTVSIRFFIVIIST